MNVGGKNISAHTIEHCILRKSATSTMTQVYTYLSLQSILILFMFILRSNSQSRYIFKYNRI